MKMTFSLRLMTVVVCMFIGGLCKTENRGCAACNALMNTFGDSFYTNKDNIVRILTSVCKVESLENCENVSQRYNDILDQHFDGGLIEGPQVCAVLFNCPE